MKLVYPKDMVVGKFYCMYESKPHSGKLYKKLNYIQVTKRLGITGCNCAIYRRDDRAIENDRTDHIFWYSVTGVNGWYYEMNDDEVVRLLMDVI